jgi:dipeptidyl aminopeptidase/acylaminoacyl peptidase
MAGPSLLALLAAAALAAAAPARAAAPGFESQDLHRLRSVRDVRISPDGSRVAYVVELSDRRGPPRAEAWIADVATGASRLFLGGAASNLRWSPDGRRLAAIVAGRDGTSLAVAAPDGSGFIRLASVLSTNHPLPSLGEGLAWSPDGRRIAFVSATPGPEPPPTSDPVVVTRYLYKPTAAEGLTRFNDNRRLHVFVVDLASRVVSPVTRGDAYEHSLAWSPARDEIAFVSNREPDADRVFNNDLFVAAVDGSALRRLTQTRSAEYTPAWSPDGASIAYLGTKRPLTSSETTMEDTHVWLAAADGGAPRELGTPIDARQEKLGWSPDGAAVFCTVEQRGSVRLYRLPVSGAPPELIAPAPGEVGLVGAWSVARNGTLAYALATAGGPAELYVRTSGDTRRLTSLNAKILSERTLAPTEAFSFRSFDGTELEAFLTRPPEISSSVRHPLVVWLHGGPHAQDGATFNLRSQVYSREGWATLAVNYRGSTGYGQKLADAIFGDQNGGEAKDVLAAIDAAVARYQWLDGGRVGVGGASYGGQLANWLVTQSDRFRAAVSLAGIANLVSFNYMAYYHDYLAVEFGAYPHENGLLDRLWERSPIRYVAKVRTPVLLLHGENDNDVPVAEAEQFYIALRDVGVETVMVRYPREGHGLREAAHAVDGIDRSVDWFRRHFKK